MAEPTLRNFIHGEYVEAKGDGGFEVVDPATEKGYATSPISGAADVDAAFSAAAAAFEQWGEVTPAERQLALFRIADAMEQRADRRTCEQTQAAEAANFRSRQVRPAQTPCAPCCLNHASCGRTKKGGPQQSATNARRSVGRAAVTGPRPA